MDGDRFELLLGSVVDQCPDICAIERPRRRRLVRAITAHVEDAIENGQESAAKLEKSAMKMVRERYQSVLVVIAIAVLAEVIAFIVKKLLEWWWERDRNEEVQ